MSTIDPAVRAWLAAYLKRENDILTAQAFGMSERAARELADARLTEAERAALAKPAEPPDRARLDAPKR